ncbi:toxin [Streptomyces monticola]|uniref:Toxin n=1 Tax=Streptomyces monticola TaxID=2666263 RepID=A0ABW2JB46_9ACTN
MTRKRRIHATGSDLLRRSSQDFVTGLALPPVPGVRDLVPEIERRSGRALSLQAAELEASETIPCGMWLATRDTHYVFYDPRTSRAHQDHIIAHEFGHILKDHRGGPTLPSKDATGLMTHIDPDVVRMVLGRTDYAEHDEMEAELIGCYLQAHTRGYEPPPSEEAARVARTLLRRGSRKP